jgi:hypothetical protein
VRRIRTELSVESRRRNLPVYAIKERLLAARRREEGAITVEYAMMIFIGVAFASVLLWIVTSDQMRTRLIDVVMRNVA